ncbi:dienelactone hydrolase family protein [Leptolyngbya sp. FACHB-711]|uniref:dienelactone hydrolase family protein n=1 Tax=Leptolyngbya sp. FACHB-711 TaxID=2692813 RepID=UPI001683A5F0|nr:dienelactone hydrolase family protein [Cyanobacteria bacterium FACHB-502]MBD2022951.1 dienelactone hydrolase family protein [Leptolyngbya sp. FACHB-711]
MPPAAIRRLEAAIQQAGGSIESHTYPNVGHAFSNDTRSEVYSASAAENAWRKTVSFLTGKL